MRLFSNDVFTCNLVCSLTAFDSQETLHLALGRVVCSQLLLISRWYQSYHICHLVYVFPTFPKEDRNCFLQLWNSDCLYHYWQERTSYIVKRYMFLIYFWIDSLPRFCDRKILLHKRSTSLPIFITLLIHFLFINCCIVAVNDTVVYWPSNRPDMLFQRRGSCMFHWRRRAWLTVWDRVKIPRYTYRLMHRKRVTCELHGSYFRYDNETCHSKDSGSDTFPMARHGERLSGRLNYYITRCRQEVSQLETDELE